MIFSSRKWWVGLVFFLWLAQLSVGQELKTYRFYVSPGLHSDDYALFFKDGAMMLERSDRMPTEVIKVKTNGVSYSLEGHVLSFQVDGRFSSTWVPLRGKLNTDGSIEIIYLWTFNQKEQRITYRLYE